MIVKRKINAQGSDAELIRLDKEYVVYGILMSESHKFLIFEEEQFSFPFFVSCEVVDLVDASGSRFWRYSPALPSSDEYSARAALMAFDEIVDNRFFYQNLVDGERMAVDGWLKAKQLLDHEASGQT